MLDVPVPYCCLKSKSSSCLGTIKVLRPFTTQLLELGIPVVVALNKTDVNDKKDTHIDVEKLSKALRCPVVETTSTTSKGLDKLIKKSYDLLGLMSFLTAGEPEVRAWTIKKGTKAPKAAGKIHSDIERGFIKAEIVSYEDLVREGSMVSAKEKGLIDIY